VCLLIGAARCLLTYAYVISTKDGGGAARRALMITGLPGGTAGRYRDPSCASRTLLLAGRRDGRLCVCSWDTGAAEYIMHVSYFIYLFIFIYLFMCLCLFICLFVILICLLFVCFFFVSLFHLFL